MLVKYSFINFKMLFKVLGFLLLIEANADAAELQVQPNARITREPVKRLNLPREMTLAAMVRDGKCYLINGDTHIQEGDYVVVFCLHGFIHKIEKWFL